MISPSFRYSGIYTWSIYREFTLNSQNYPIFALKQPNTIMLDRDLVRRQFPLPQGTIYLLAIAINDYRHCNKLNNAVHDVEVFIQIMTTRYRLEPQHITFIKDGEATKNRIENAFDDLIDIVEPQDNLIVYFSGHGR